MLGVRAMRQQVLNHNHLALRRMHRKRGRSFAVRSVDADTVIEKPLHRAAVVRDPARTRRTAFRGPTRSKARSSRRYRHPRGVLPGVPDAVIRPAENLQAPVVIERQRAHPANGARECRRAPIGRAIPIHVRFATSGRERLTLGRSIVALTSGILDYSWGQHSRTLNDSLLLVLPGLGPDGS